MLTVIIKTNNNEDTISEVLESTKNLGEIFVIDEHSSDDTIPISQEYKAHVIYSSVLDFSSAFNQVLSETKNDWILLIEGDEIIPDSLGKNILKYIENPKKNKNAIFIPSKFFYLNKEIKAARKKELRLFKKDTAEFINNYSIDLVPKKTKKYILNSDFKNNKNCILKFEKRDIFAVFQNKINKIVIKSKKQEKMKSSVFIKPFLGFIYTYLLKGGLLDGKEGFIYSFNKAVEIFIFECSIFEKGIKNEKY